MAQDQTSAFTPFVAVKRDAALSRVAAIIAPDAPESVEVRFEDQPSSGRAWQIVAQVPHGDRVLTLDLSPVDPDRRSWFAVGDFAVGYRKLEDGTDPYADPELAARLKSLRASMSAAESAAADATEAVDAYLPFDKIRDEFYRQISYSGGEGDNGFLRLGFRCNQNCHFCWQDRSWPDAPEGYYETWLDELAAGGVRQLTITGGEPTLNRTLPQLVERAARTHGVHVILETNAIRFAKPDYAAAMKDAGVGSLFVSYHSPDAEISDEMTRAPGTHRRTELGVAGALEAGIKVNLNCVVEARNHRDLERHARTIVDRFVTPFPGNPVRCVTYSMAMDYFDHALWRDRVVSLDAVEPHLTAAARVLIDAGVEVQALGTCGFPPCVLRNVPEAIWWLDTERVAQLDADGRAYAGICNDCNERGRCLGPRREYVAMFGDQGLVPFR